jgi:hypothetical protein
MMEKKFWFMSSAARGIDVDAARDEPSHIHIARPSRLRPDTIGSSLEQPAGELRELDPAARTGHVPGRLIAVAAALHRRANVRGAASSL